MPAAIPLVVKTLPSSTQRAEGTHSTFGPVEVAHGQARLLVVAFLPSRTPARERMVAPVQMEMMYLSWDHSQCLVSTGNWGYLAYLGVDFLDKRNLFGHVLACTAATGD
jgi:hypothetical protein